MCIVWKSCTLTAFIHSSTGPVDHPFRSCHEGAGFNPWGGGVLLWNWYSPVSIAWLHLFICSKTTLTGESRFHINTPLGIEPGSLMTGSKQVVHWTRETWWELSEIAGSTQCSPPAADSVGCEAGRETCSECETGTGELCEIKWDYHIVGTRA
jgi:hypothetical protein